MRRRESELTCRLGSVARTSEWQVWWPWVQTRNAWTVGHWDIGDTSGQGSWLDVACPLSTKNSSFCVGWRLYYLHYSTAPLRGGTMLHRTSLGQGVAGSVS